MSTNSSDAKAAILNQVQQEAAMANARQLISKVTSNCFDKCIVTPPGTSLSKKDETCVAQCTEKYVAMWNAVSKQYVSRLSRSRDADQLSFEVAQ